MVAVIPGKIARVSNAPAVVSPKSARVPWPDSFKHAPRDQTHVSPPSSSMLPRYHAEGHLDPGAWGNALRPIVDRHVGPGTEGMVLIRGLPTDTAQEFAELMAGCGEGRWKRRTYEPFGEPRKTVGSIDLATNIPPSHFLACHNEMTYNPYPNDIIVLACNTVAHTGGESLIARNADYTALVSPELQEFLKARGGIRYVRPYFDATAEAPPGGFGMSWQSRCGLDEASADRDAAAAEFKRRLGPDVTLEWDSSGGLKVCNVTPAFNADGDWCNILGQLAPWGLATAADSEPVPGALLEGLEEAEAAAYRALLLEPGDVLVLDNMRTAHGRLPFADGGGTERRLFTFLADWGP